MSGATAFPSTRQVLVRLDDNPRYKGSIHDDAVARARGYRAALVPGAFVYGYVSRLAVDAMGLAFAEHGAISVRFRRPVFNGDRLDVAAAAMTPGNGVLRADVEVRNGDAEVVATGFLAMPEGEAPVAPALPDLVMAERPAEVPRVPAGALEAGRRTTTVPFELTREMLERSRADFGEDSPLYPREDIAHTGCLMRLAMDETNKSFRFPGPIVLVEAAAQHFAVVRPGDRLASSGRIVETFERNGRHYFVSEEYLVGNGGTVAARFRRTTIYA